MRCCLAYPQRGYREEHQDCTKSTRKSSCSQLFLVPLGVNPYPFECHSAVPADLPHGDVPSPPVVDAAEAVQEGPRHAGGDDETGEGPQDPEPVHGFTRETLVD